MMKYFLLATLLATPSMPAFGCTLPGPGAYQLATGGIIRESDHAFIPADPRNSDYTCYEAWVAAGNIPVAALPQNPQIKATADLSAKIAAGLAITSATYPALDGTYAIDPATQSKIQAVSLYIEVNGKFPAGYTAFPWEDVSGLTHTFPTTAEFLAFASAEADYVTRINLQSQVEAAGGTPSWPSASATIP